PTGGDLRTAASVEAPLQVLANRIEYGRVNGRAAFTASGIAMPLVSSSGTVVLGKWVESNSLWVQTDVSIAMALAFELTGHLPIGATLANYSLYIDGNGGGTGHG